MINSNLQSKIILKPFNLHANSPFFKSQNTNDDKNCLVITDELRSIYLMKLTLTQQFKDKKFQHRWCLSEFLLYIFMIKPNRRRPW